jgi:hypothetical protein
MSDPGRNEKVARCLIDCVKNGEVPDSLLLQKLDEPPAWPPEFVL